MAKDNRLSKTISNQDKYEFGLLTTAPTSTTKQYVNSLKDNILTGNTGFTFGQICESLRNKEDYLCGISTNTGNQLMYKDRNIGYCLLPNETTPSNVTIWKSFWNEIGDNVDTANGKYPVICWGQSTLMLENSITKLEKTHEESANLKTYKRYSSLQCCNITPLFENSQPLIIQPGETKTVSINFYASLDLMYEPNYSIYEDYEEYENFAAENNTYYVEFSKLRLYDEHKNIVKQIPMMDSGSSVTSWSAGYSVMIENNTSNIQKICYFDVVADVYVGSNKFSYQIVDLMTGNVVQTIDTNVIDLKMNFVVKNFESFDYTNLDSSMQPIGESNNAIYIIPHKCYEVDLNNEWCRDFESSITNSGAYEGPYRSWSNMGIDNSSAKMYITIHGYDTFKLYVRSYAEEDDDTIFDYLMVSQLDKDIDHNTPYNNTTLVKDHTKNVDLTVSQKTDISGYKLVTFTNIGGGTHKITVVYKKDSSTSERADRGYVVIPTGQEKYSSTNVKGGYYSTFWNETSKKYWPMSTAASLSNTYDTVIKASATSLYAYKYNKTTGKYYANSTSSGYAQRFRGNYYNILDYANAHVTKWADFQYSKTTLNTSYKNIHIYNDYISPNVPQPSTFAGIYKYCYVDSDIFNGITGSGTNRVIFYPGKIKDQYSWSSTTAPISGNTLINSNKIIQYDKGNIVAYFIPANTSVSPGVYVKAYVAHGLSGSTDTAFWDPGTSSSTTIFGGSLIGYNLYPAYNNIVLVTHTGSYNMIDIYVYNATTGEFYNNYTTRKLQFGA